eukprot:TRINITY_DN9860_c0_g1_i1.p3 TRINITY_DN9860_c0_g1~~TRINITY_DN9860_c0_g1_i1.p3  ORF type:complete len:138 (-),score=15.68 TRINITY_DN9860_c0_g1_i1:29-442(-)
MMNMVVMMDLVLVMVLVLVVMMVQMVMLVMEILTKEIIPVVRHTGRPRSEHEQGSRQLAEGPRFTLSSHHSDILRLIAVLEQAGRVRFVMFTQPKSGRVTAKVVVLLAGVVCILVQILRVVILSIGYPPYKLMLLLR